MAGYCGQCGTKITEQSNYCKECGNKLSGTSEKQQASDENGRPITSIPLIIIGVVLVLAGVGMMLSGLTQMQAAQEWESEGFVLRNTETGQCERIGPTGQSEPVPCENPYKGGGGSVIFGLAVTTGGGAAIYKGTR